MEKCFALNFEGKCLALKEKKCENCNFYRTDLNIYHIEREIEYYSPEGKKDGNKILLRK